MEGSSKLNVIVWISIILNFYYFNLQMVRVENNEFSLTESFNDSKMFASKNVHSILHFHMLEIKPTKVILSAPTSYFYDTKESNPHIHPYKHASPHGRTHVHTRNHTTAKSPNTFLKKIVCSFHQKASFPGLSSVKIFCKTTWTALCVQILQLQIV